MSSILSELLLSKLSSFLECQTLKEKEMMWISPDREKTKPDAWYVFLTTDCQRTKECVPIAFGPTMWTNPVEKLMNTSGNTTHATYCKGGENASSAYIQLYAVKQKTGAHVQKLSSIIRSRARIFFFPHLLDISQWHNPWESSAAP